VNINARIPLPANRHAVISVPGRMTHREADILKTWSKLKRGKETMLKFGIPRNSQKSSEYEGGTMSDDDVWKKASGRGKPGPEPPIPRGVPNTDTPNNRLDDTNKHI